MRSESVSAKTVSDNVEKYFVLLVILAAVVASITGLRNGFALDDVEVILKDPRIHTLAAPWSFFHASYWQPKLGSSLYRPMTMVVFALQWAIGRGSPLPFHIVNIALYAALAVAVYRLGRLAMPPVPSLSAALIFAVHPVHVEAVANVVGQAEIWVALILVLVAIRYIHVRRAGPLSLRHVLEISAAYLIACGFKEHAIMLPLILVAAEFLMVDEPAPLGRRLKSLLPLAISLMVVGIAFIAIRYAVLHGLAQDSEAWIFRGQPFAGRFFTMLSVIVEWIRLFVWPMSLSADYSYPRIRPHTGLELQMIPGIAVIIAVAWIGWTLRKRSPVAAFGIAWIAIAMLIPSNLLIPTGFVLAERTLLLATVGVALCAGAAVEEIIPHLQHSGRRAQALAGCAFAALLVLFAGKSMTRSPVWRDNPTLIDQTVLDVPSSHRAHWMRAVNLADRKRPSEALDEIDLAVAFSDHKDALLLAYAADMFATAGRCPRAVTLYRRALFLAPGNVQLRANTSFCLIAIGKLDEAKKIALSAGVQSADSRLQAIVHRVDSLEGGHPKTLALR